MVTNLRNFIWDRNITKMIYILNKTETKQKNNNKLITIISGLINSRLTYYQRICYKKSVDRTSLMINDKQISKGF